MIHFLELIIVIFFGVLGGVALLFAGWIILLILVPISMLAWDNKRGKATPLDQDYTRDWEREFESWLD